MKSSGYLNNAKGAVAPLVAIMLVVIIVCVAVVVDLGHIHNVKVQLQRAVDAAALGGANELPAEDAAVDAAAAVAAANRVDQDAVVIDPNTDVILGTWDKEIIPGQTADDRFDETGTPPNAVKVTASRVVDHVFFFFLPSTTITADAIAVYKYEEETIPIALVSCIPTGGTSLNIASPGLSICDIATYRFNSDTEDTAAWTSLTFNPASNTNIRQFLTEEGRELFNKVIYGTGSSPEHQGIENTEVFTGGRDLPVPDVDTYESGGCLTNDGTSISCGLGEDISLDPESITDIRKLDSNKVPSAAQTDPLAYDPLPRWYHFDDPAGSYDYLNDAFTRVWTQDGNLVAESETALQTKLADLYFEITQPYGIDDHRFKSFIECQGPCSDPADRGSYSYEPNYNEVLRYAGYPPVWVNNGSIPPALDEFLERIVNDDSSDTFKNTLSADNEPFESGNETNSGGSGYTVQLTLPVIFAGNCDDWAALSVGPPTNTINLYYVGTANFLVTRCWRNPNCYEQESTPLTVTNWSPSDSDTGCSSSDFDPPLTAGDSFQCTGGPPGGTPNAALEGTIRPPIRGDDATAGIKKIYLVE